MNAKVIRILFTPLICLGLAPCQGRYFEDYGSAASVKCPKTSPQIETMRIISRIDWESDRPRMPPSNLTIKPIECVIIGHTDTKSCLDEFECGYLLREVQKLGSRGWGKTGNNFFIGGDGEIYEGLGWKLREAKIKGYSCWSLDIALIGEFESLKPNIKQIEAAKRFLRYAVQKGKLDEKYKLVAHRQIAVTNSPGLEAYNVIRNWKHWTDLAS